MGKNFINVGFSPLTSTNNKYIDITVECIRKTGANVYDFYSIFRSPFIFFKTDLVILNWFERLGQTIFQRNIKLFIKIIIISVLKITKKKIVYVFHNRINHEEIGSLQSYRFMKYICKNSDRIIILCSASYKYLEDYISANAVKNKAFLIPHPDYIGSYIPNKIKLKNKFPNIYDTSKIIFLFVGAIRPYKNIELIIDCARHYKNFPFNFIIAGRPRTQSYALDLSNYAKGLENVNFIFEFLDDDIITALIEASDVLLLPYDTTSSLNSGTVILSFSNSRTVISPKIGTILDFSPEVAFTYEYNSTENHQKALFNTIDQIAYLQNHLNIDSSAYINEIRNRLRYKGYLAYKELVNKNSKNIIINKYNELFTELQKL